VTPDEERRRTLREAVRAFRFAVAVLKNPALTLFTDLAVPEVVRDLEREPALVSFSPFDALPDDAAYGRGERAHQPTRVPRRISDRPSGRGTARYGRPQAVPSGTGEPAAEEPPSFSFRRSGASGVPAEQRDRDPGEGARTSKGDFHVPETAQRDREGSAATEKRPGGHLRSYPGTTTDGGGIEMGAADPTPGNHSSVHPMTLLDDLARAAFNMAEPRMPEDFLRPSGASTPWSVGLQEAARGDRGHHGIDDHTQSDPGLGAYDNGAGALIGSLADHLLAREARVGRGSSAEVSDDGVAQSVAPRVREQTGGEMVMDSSPIPFSDGADKELDGRSGWPDANPIASASDRHTEAETLAALVNEVLVRQARRHGVDLS
jgi:hypothetical protein